MPMSTLANFGGMSLDHDALDRITGQCARGSGVVRGGADPPVLEDGTGRRARRRSVPSVVGLDEGLGGGRVRTSETSHNAFTCGMP